MNCFTTLFSDYLRQTLCFTIALSLIVQPIAAAEVVFNQITTQQVQQIRPQTNHPDQYALQLSPDLWNLSDQHPVILMQGNAALGLFYRDQGLGPLIFRALNHPLEENNDTSNQSTKPCHFHFFPDAQGKVTHGELQVQTTGRFSLHAGEYGGTTHIEANRLYINVKKDNKTSQTKIMGSLFLKGLEEINNRAPLKIQGHVGVSTPLLENTGNIQAKGKGVFQVNQADNHAILQFSKDSVITGYGDKAPFTRFHNHNKIASKMKLTLNGQNFKQEKNGICFSGIALQGVIDNLSVQGKFVAPLLSLKAEKSLSFTESLSQGYAIHLKTQNWLGKKQPVFRAKNGLYIDAGSMGGNGRFEIGAISDWSFPYHHFYEDASPKGKRANKLSKAASAYFKTNSQEIPSIFGCYLKANSLHLDDQTRFNLVSGSTKFETNFANISGIVRNGPYNQHGISINAQELAFPGILSTVQADIQGYTANLSGEFKVKDLTLSVDNLNITGKMEGETLQSLGRFLNISSSGLVTFKNAVLNHDQISIHGHLNSQKLETIANTFQVGPTGDLRCIHADLNNQQTVMDGLVKAGSLAIQGNLDVPGSVNAGSMVIQGNLDVPGSVDVKSIDIHGDSVGITGVMKAGHVTNHAPVWSVKGKANIDSFTSLTSSLSLSGGKDFTIRNATIQALTTTLGGSLNIHNLVLHGDRLHLNSEANIKGYNWNLNLDHHFDQKGNLNLSHLSLSTPYWHQAWGTQLTVGQGDVHVDNADLQGLINGGTFQGRINHLNLIGGIASRTVNLQGTHFNNQGWIHNSDGIGLAYDTYHLGRLSTQGTLGLKLNDRMINGALLKNFEGRFGYKMLSLTTNQHLEFTEDLELHKSLALSAPSITFKSAPLQRKKYSFFGKYLDSLTPETPMKTWTVHGDLMLESRNHSLSLSNFKMMAHTGSFHSGGDFILNGSTIQTQNQLLFDVRGNTVLNRTNRPSLLSAGWGGMYGNVDGKFINNVSDMSSLGDMEISARQGFEFHAKEEHHHESHTKKTWYGSKQTTTREWNEVTSPTLQSVGHVKLISQERGAFFDSTRLESPSLITVATRGPVLNLERILYNHTVTKKRTLFTSKRTDMKTQGDSPTVMVSREGVEVISWDDKIDLPNTVIMAPHVLLDAEKDVRLTVPTLRSEYSYESSGLSFSHALSGISTDPLGALIAMDPVTNSLRTLYDARSQNPINATSAGMMAGISGYNAYKGYQDTVLRGNGFGSFIGNRLLTNLGRVQIGYHDVSHSAYQTMPGQGGIFAGELEIRSREGNIYTLNGVPLDVGKLTLSCPNGSWFREGFKSEYGGSSESSNLSMGFNLITPSPTDVSVSSSSRGYEGVHWIPQQITDKNPTIVGKSVLSLDGVDSFHHSQKGVGFSIGPNSFGFNINDYGLSYAAAPGDGMLGFFGVQAKGMNFVVPMMAGKSGDIGIREKKVASLVHLETQSEANGTVSDESKKEGIPRPTSSKSGMSHSKAQPETISSQKSIVVVDPIESSEDVKNSSEDKTLSTYSEEEGQNKSYLEAIGNGGKKAFDGLVDCVIKGSGFVKDSLILYAANVQEAQNRDFFPGDENPISVKDSVVYRNAEKNVHAVNQAVVGGIQSTLSLIGDTAGIFGHALHQATIDEMFGEGLVSISPNRESESQMRDRFQIMSKAYNHFYDLSRVNKVEKTTEFVMSFVMPSVFAKSVQAAAGVNQINSLAKMNPLKGENRSIQKNLFSNSRKNKESVPFVANPEAGKWTLSEMHYSGILPMRVYIQDGKVLGRDDLLHLIKSYPDQIDTFGMKRHIDMIDSIAKMTYNPKAPFVVIGHAIEDFIARDTILVNAAEKLSVKLVYQEHFTPKYLSKLLEKTPTYKAGTPVALYSCERAKKIEGNYAQHVSNKTGADTTAIDTPIDLPTLTRNIIKARKKSEKERKLKFGKFKTYHPGEWRPKKPVEPFTMKSNAMKMDIK